MKAFIPQKIQFSPKSKELVCMHEAGHVFQMLKLGVYPKFVEINNDHGEWIGRTRAQIFEDDDRRNVSVGGYIAELVLFYNKRLIDQNGMEVAEKDFIDGAIAQHASQDKVMFFGKDLEESNGCWPKICDEHFMKWANNLRSEFRLPVVELIAEGLLEKEKITDEDIKSLLGQ